MPDLTRRSFVAGLAAAAVGGVARVKGKPRRKHTRTIMDEVRMRSTAVAIGTQSGGQSLTRTPTDTVALTDSRSVVLNSGVIFGHNLFGSDAYLGVGETVTQVRTRTLADYGRIPMAKMFYPTALPSSWASGVEGMVPEKRILLTHKDINAGRIATHRQSIPVGWHVYYCYWQESNDDIRDGTLTPEGVPLTVQRYKDAYTTLYDTIHAHDNPAVRGTAEAWHCFIPPAGAGQTAATVASYVDLATTDGVCFDPYLNPTGGLGLDQPVYTTPNANLDSCFDVLDLLGVTRWGIGEFNTPMRNWDRPAGNARTTALLDYIDYCMTYPSPPEFILLWNADGNNWDQRIINDDPIFPPGGAGARTVTYAGPESFIAAYAAVVATSA